MNSEPAQPRHHFYYWRLAPSDSTAAVAAMQQWQATLRDAWPALCARLYLRCEAERCTLMEGYDLGADIPKVLAEQLHEEGDVVTAPWRRGLRQLEAFADAG